MRPKKYQTGGVFDVNPVVPDVGQIAPVPRLTQPQVSATPLANVLSLSRDAETRRMRDEQRAAKEQSLLDADQDQYFTLRDSVFGEVHNPQQEALFAAKRKQYGVVDAQEFDLNNPNALKTQIRAYQMFLSDPEVNKNLGDIEGAKKLIQLAASPGSMDAAERADYQKRLDEYLQWDRPERFPVYSALAPSAVNKPKAADKTKLFYATQGVIGRNAGIDLSDDRNVAVLFHNVATAWDQTDREGAVRSGYIDFDPNTGSPILTDLGKQTAINQVAGMQITSGYKQGEKKELIDYRDTKSDQNRAETESRKTSSVKVKDPVKYAALWDDYKTDRSINGQDIGGLDPNDPEVRVLFDKVLTQNGALTDTEKNREVIAEQLQALKAKRELEVGEEFVRQNNPFGVPQSTLPPPPQTSSTTQTTVSPVKQMTLKERMALKKQR